MEENLIKYSGQQRERGERKRKRHGSWDDMHVEKEEEEEGVHWDVTVDKRR